MKHTMKTMRTLLGMGVGLGLGIGALSAPGAAWPPGAYAWMKRLFIKAGDSAADVTVRQAITAGSPHEEYELTTPGYSYSDQFWGTFRGQAMPVRYRSMWRDPLNLEVHYETYNNMVLQDRYPFFYVMHNARYDCKSSGDPANSYDFGIRATAVYLIKDRVVRSASGHEVLFHPVNYQFGLTTLAVNCLGTHVPTSMIEMGSATVARDGAIHRSPSFPSADVDYLVATYATLY